MNPVTRVPELCVPNPQRMLPLSPHLHTTLQQEKPSFSLFFFFFYHSLLTGGETEARVQVIPIPKSPLLVPLTPSLPFRLPLTWASRRKRLGAARSDPSAPARSPAGTRPRPARDAGARVPGARTCAARAPEDLERLGGQGSGARVRVSGCLPS